MADPLPPLTAPDHSDAWTFAYLDDELSPTERSAFEEHMKSHADCREEVETMRAALPAVVRVLTEAGPLQSGKDFLAGAEARRKVKQAAGSPHPALSPGRGEGGGRDRIPSPPAGERARVRGRRVWAWAGGGFAGLAAAAAAVLVVLQPFTAGLEPQVLGAVGMAPLRDDTAHPVGPEPGVLAASATLRFGRLLLDAPRLPTDAYTAVVLIDSRGKRWLVQGGDQRDPLCLPQCGRLQLRVELDKLAPGALTVALLVSTRPIAGGEMQDWLKEGNQAPSRLLGVRGYAVLKVDR